MMAASTDWNDLTPWFPADVTPHRRGVYEVKSDEPQRAFAYWNGYRFCWRTWSYDDCNLNFTVDSAYAARSYETGLPSRIEWRGLSRKP